MFLGFNSFVCLRARPGGFTGRRPIAERVLHGHIRQPIKTHFALIVLTHTGRVWRSEGKDQRSAKHQLSLFCAWSRQKWYLWQRGDGRVLSLGWSTQRSPADAAVSDNGGHWILLTSGDRQWSRQQTLHDAAIARTLGEEARRQTGIWSVKQGGCLVIVGRGVLLKFIPPSQVHSWAQSPTNIICMLHDLHFFHYPFKLVHRTK